MIKILNFLQAENAWLSGEMSSFIIIFKIIFFDRKKEFLYIQVFFHCQTVKTDQKHIELQKFHPWTVYIPHYQSEVLSIEFHFKGNRKLGLK